ncbi:uncharacterized protein LOC125151812 [Prionailurus viverrinus]|uniref:uncharacterized protein LOC125151812 n=1 Tax=Prionailurus viverrinus TaxID=61388 RepID=UPI001FF67081|nr:uncharacterized protein LOC125151812 [Prionailurus viverrinus]
MFTAIFSGRRGIRGGFDPLPVSVLASRCVLCSHTWLRWWPRRRRDLASVVGGGSPGPLRRCGAGSYEAQTGPWCTESLRLLTPVPEVDADQESGPRGRPFSLCTWAPGADEQTGPERASNLPEATQHSSTRTQESVPSVTTRRPGQPQGAGDTRPHGRDGAWTVSVPSVSTVLPTGERRQGHGRDDNRPSLPTRTSVKFSAGSGRAASVSLGNFRMLSRHTPVYFAGLRLSPAPQGGAAARIQAVPPSRSRASPRSRFLPGDRRTSCRRAVC